MSADVLFDTAGNPTRWHDPATSHAAGASVNLYASEAYALGLLAEIGASTDERLCAVAASRGAKWTAQRLRSARAALVLAGRVVRVEPDGKTVTGRAARRWRAVS